MRVEIFCETYFLYPTYTNLIYRIYFDPRRTGNYDQVPKFAEAGRIIDQQYALVEVSSIERGNYFSTNQDLLYNRRLPFCNQS